MENQIILFEDINNNNEHLVGGKAANLGKLIQNGFNVPNGFVVSTDVFKELCLSNIPGVLFDELDMIDYQELGEISETSQKIRDFIINECNVTEIESLVSKIIINGGLENSYAVRSSATAEDMPSMSFAGQQDTYLNVIGVNSMAVHIIKCWSSLYTDRAVIYRKKNRIKEQDVLMAVVVQKLIKSVKSGIMFTANPLTNNYEELTIDAGLGLGETLVSGLVTPDMYKWSKKEKKIKEKIISKKNISMRALESGGTEKTNINEDQQENPVLSDEEVMKVSRVGTKIEDYYGSPQDIEWGIDEKDTLYILQSRSITSLYPRVKNVKTDSVHVSFNHIQVMTSPISPMGISFISMVFPIGKDKETNLCRFISSAGGRIYIDYTGLATLPTRKIGFNLLENVDYLISDGVRKYCDMYNVKKKMPRAKVVLNAAKELKPIAKKMRHNFKAEKNLNVKKETEEFIKDICGKFEDKITKETDQTAKLNIIKNDLSQIFKTLASEIITNIGPGIISYKYLGKMLVKYNLESGLADRLVAGLEGNITTEMGLDVYNMADAIRNDENSIKILENNKAHAHEVLMADEGTEISGVIKEFLKKYGMRGAEEIDISSPRYKEDFTPISSSILNYIKEHNAGDHLDNFRNLVVGSNESALDLKNILSAKGASKKDLKKADNYIRNIKTYMPMREHGKYGLMQTFGMANDVLKLCGKHLEENNIIDNWRDVYYLDIDELITACGEDVKLQKHIKERKEEYDVYKTLTPPRVMAGTGEIINGTYTNRNLPDDALVGIGVSSGIYEGYARVILDSSENTLKNGEILVTKFTDPGWTPLFVNAKGLVLEVGGLMTHGAIVAREYGIPGVVGIESATTNIKTGDYIRVNGDEGFVEVINKPDN